MRTSRSLIAVLALVAVALAAMVAIPAVAATPSQSRLVNVRVGAHSGFDRVVFEFSGPLPSARSVRYVDHVFAGGSGARVGVAGAAILEVTMRDTVAHDEAGRQTALRREAYTNPNVITVVRASDFEGVVTYGIGLAKREGIEVFTLRSPNRLVIDIETDFRRTTRKVWFQDQDAYAAGRQPETVAVTRQVPAAAPAGGALHRLYAGPTRAERAAGLRLVASGTYGFERLSISDGVADLRLRGRCSSGGATFTVADLIRPTLKQFDSVRWVRIRDQDGATARSTGQRDSLPTCLEP